MGPRVEAVVAGLCGPAHPHAPLLRAWCADPAFLAFAAAHENKIRRKLRQAGGGEAGLDVLSELAAARLWLADRRFRVVYEPDRSAGGRSADLGVTFRTHTRLNVEVTRLRDARPDEATRPPDLKLARALGAKAGQLAPGAVNLLLVVLPGAAPLTDPASVLDGAFRHLNGGTVLPGDLGPAFQRGRPRLSGVVLAALDGPAGLRVVHVWVNAGAKHTLPDEVTRFLRAGA
ncbi:hypothetical protein [Deinococcus enclensis]|uniref:Uncharacterized protein n=1 Tax=Deinococcus enclensis TaxID=1049582 RepID=A0ABT9MCU1_9DEIO|nr:hypothetical protein [Deinococcus enclensis]MDP9764428.1 hypothetical protein [Deinococcus enclensis]